MFLILNRRIPIISSQIYRRHAKKFKMADVNVAKTPMPTNCQLNLDPNGKEVDQKIYRSMIISLFYLSVSKPVIMMSVSMCAIYHSAPKEIH